MRRVLKSSIYNNNSDNNDNDNNNNRKQKGAIIRCCFKFQSSLSYNHAHKSVQTSSPQDFRGHFDRYLFLFMFCLSASGRQM